MGYKITLNELFNLLSNLNFKDEETGEKLRVKQIYIKHYKNLKRALSFIREFIDDTEKLEETKIKLEKEGLIWFFVVDNYYGNEYLKVYIVKLINDKEKVITP